jgi:hypothetical protein
MDADGKARLPDARSNRRVGMTRWVGIPPRCGYVIVPVEQRSILVLVPITEAGIVSLKIAGYFLDEWTYVGEKREVLTFRVEEIAVTDGESLVPKILAQLPADLRGMPVSF